jgi:phage protein D
VTSIRTGAQEQLIFSEEEKSISSTENRVSKVSKKPKKKKNWAVEKDDRRRTGLGTFK